MHTDLKPLTPAERRFVEALARIIARRYVKKRQAEREKLPPARAADS